MNLVCGMTISTIYWGLELVPIFMLIHMNEMRTIHPVRWDSIFNSNTSGRDEDYNELKQSWFAQD